MSKWKYEIIEKNMKKYIWLSSEKNTIENEEEIMDLMSICFENNIELLLIDNNVLSDSFYNLKTGFAGMVIQKLVNYNIKIAVIIDKEMISKRFKEFLIESNKGNHFGGFSDLDVAEKWLITNWA